MQNSSFAKYVHRYPYRCNRNISYIPFTGYSHFANNDDEKLNAITNQKNIIVGGYDCNNGGFFDFVVNDKTN